MGMRLEKSYIASWGFQRSHEEKAVTSIVYLHAVDGSIQLRQRLLEYPMTGKALVSISLVECLPKFGTSL